MNNSIGSISPPQAGSSAPRAELGDVRRPRPEPSANNPGKPKGEWKVYLPAKALDAFSSELGKLDDRLAMTLLKLESLCRDRAYCDYSNDALCRFFGCPERTLQDKLRDAEEAKLIHRYRTKRGKTVRYAIFLLARFDDQRPTVDLVKDADFIMNVVQEMRRKPAPYSTRNSVQNSTRNSVPLLNYVVVEKDGDEKTEPDFDPVQRQRPEAALDLAEAEAWEELEEPAEEEPANPSPPTPPPVEPAIAVVPVAALPVVAEAIAPPALSAGQEQWLASLNASERERFDALPAKDRGEFLAPHRLGLDRIIAREWALRLRPPAPAAPPPPVPATTAELWEALPGGPPDWIQQAANDLVRDFSDPKFHRAFEGLAKAVWSGDIAAWKVVDAHRQAMKPESKNRGAVFNHALKNHAVLWEGTSR